MRVRIGTRSSRLALWQARRVAELLQAARPGTEIRIVELSTEGDEIVDRALPEIGGEGVFTERIERALFDGSVDIAVHSLKDLPVDSRPGLLVGAVMDRVEVREALISRNGVSLGALPAGSVVGTSSTRRKAQLLALRRDLVVRPIRGNVETRIAKVESGQFDATLLAGAGVVRLGLAGRISEWMTLSDFLPAPGQGALGVQCRADDSAVIGLLKEIDDEVVHAATVAERGFLGLLGCGCSAPVAAYAEPRTEGGHLVLHMRARVSAPDGTRTIDAHGSGGDPMALAEELVRHARAAGAETILADARGGKGRPAGLSSADGKGGTSLRGMRILVTRAGEQARAVCEMLESGGAIPILLPMIRIDPLPASAELQAAVRGIASYTWVIFSSANGVDSFLRTAEQIAGHPVLMGSGRPAEGKPGRGPMVAAVGPATADALARWGITPEFVPAAHDGAALAAGVAAEAPAGIAGARILFPRAAAAREETIDVLRERGALVEDIPVYRTLPAEIPESDLAAIRGGVDAILFMSGSAVHAFCDRTRETAELAVAARNALIACIGSATAEAARARGLPVHVLSSEHTAAGLVAALAERVAAGTGATQ